MVTQRRRAGCSRAAASGTVEALLEASDHDILLGLGEELPVGIWVARVPGGEQVYVNRMYRETLGIEAHYDASTASFASPFNVYGRDGKLYPESRMPFVRALAERRVVTCEDLTIHRADGKKIDVRAIARPLGNPMSHIVVSYADISREVAAERARGETEQRLRRAQRLEAIGALAGGIAHDFNNLIFSIKLLAADVANGASQLEPKARQALADIDEITDRSAAMTRSLLGFARRSKHRSVSVSVNDVVTSMTELLGRTLSGIELSFDLEASERGSVVGDQAQLEQVVMNLVLHACDAMHGQGRIVVRTLDRSPNDGPRQVVLEIADNSAGISEQVVDRAAEPYATARNTGGELDAGLSTVFSIVEAHGGKVEVDSGLDGAGTALRVVLPAAPRSAARVRIAPADLPRGSGAILVVDDDAMVRKVVAGSLASLGYTPVEAISGDDAIEIYRQRQGEIRAVVLDMMMRGLEGRATYLGLRDVNPSVAVLLMSGHSLNEQVQEILDLGVKSFVSKPYSIAQLASAMADLLKG